jgi:class 3 adenylate cyclase/predicted ATPase
MLAVQGATMNVTDWLQNVGLGQYAAAFRENEIDEQVLPRLTAEDLKDLGVVLVGHRRRLLDAIAALRDSGTTAGVAVKTEGLAPIGDDRSAPTQPPTAERRQLTVMFCDLVGSTALASRLDPEDLRDVIAAYQAKVAKVVKRYDGFIAKYMGDGILVYFGYPHAHEDDAEKAVRAGLKLVARVAALRPPADVVLHARVGIATGLVVVGDLIGSGDAQERGIVGVTPNLAARLQSLAAADAVLIGARTYQLVGNLFDIRDLGTVEVKGFAEPVAAYQVLRPNIIESRFAALHSGGLTPLVGREEEIELLLRRWRQAKEDGGRAVLLSGEPGIGKSRIARAIEERLVGESHTRLLYFCSPHHQASALYPFIGQLERAAGFERDDSADLKLSKLDVLLARSSQDLAHDAALLAELLSIPTGDRYAPQPESTPQKRKEDTFATLLAQLDGLTARQSLLVIFEDAHWIDPTSRELLERTVDQVATLPILLIITARPEFAPSWINRPHVTVHSLSRLARREALAMVEGLASEQALPRALVDQIVARADGVPLFVEELTKSLLEAGAGPESDGGSAKPPPSLSVPATLHASLMARLDRLGPVAKDVAQVGAAIGREFSYDLLAAVAQQSEADLHAALGRLADAGLVFRRGALPGATFLFKHALVQDAAYGTLLRDPRHALHARIATVLEQRFPETAETRPELLAHHFTRASMAEQAIRYWLRAGERARERSANIEAIAHFSNGLSLVTALPDTAQRVETEFALQIGLGGSLIAAKGWSAPEVEQTYIRAQELCEQLGRSSDLFPVQKGLWYCYYIRGNLIRARDIAEHLVLLTEGQEDPLRRALACRALGSTLYTLGRFAEAGEQFNRGIELDEAAALSENHRAQILLYADCPGVICRLHLACCQWLLGFPDRALATVEAALHLSQKLEHPYFIAWAHTWAAIVHQWRGEPKAATERAETAMAVSRKHGFASWLAMATVSRGIALVRLGRHEEGVAELRAGFDGWHAIGARTLDSMWLAFIAEAHAAVEEVDAAFAALDHACETAATNAEAFYLAEVHRLRGTLHAGQRSHGDAQRWLNEAIDFARDQAGRSLELRAATSLAEVWRGQGRRAEAHALLAPVYAWFTEGFDTLDLQNAKALLDELQ